MTPGDSQLSEPRRRGRPLAHQRAAIDVGGRRPPGKRPHRERLRDAEAQLAGQQLEERETLPASQPRSSDHLRAARPAVACAAAGCSLDPLGEAQRLRSRPAARSGIVGDLIEDHAPFRRRRRRRRSTRRGATLDAGERPASTREWPVGQQRLRRRPVRKNTAHAASAAGAAAKVAGRSPRPWRWSRSCRRSRRKLAKRVHS